MPFSKHSSSHLVTWRDSVRWWQRWWRLPLLFLNDSTGSTLPLTSQSYWRKENTIDPLPQDRYRGEVMGMFSALKNKAQMRQFASSHHGIPCNQRTKGKRQLIFIELLTQPESAEILVLHRCYSKHTSDGEYKCLRAKLADLNIRCMTKHPGLEAVCLNEYVLETPITDIGNTMDNMRETWRSKQSICTQGHKAECTRLRIASGWIRPLYECSCVSGVLIYSAKYIIKATPCGIPHDFDKSC